MAKNDLPFFLALMTHLAEHGVNCPLPVKARDGEALRELSGRPAAIITFLEGVWPRKPNVAHCAGVGEGLARMHLAGANFAIKRAQCAVGLRAGGRCSMRRAPRRRGAAGPACVSRRRARLSLERGLADAICRKA